MRLVAVRSPARAATARTDAIGRRPREADQRPVRAAGAPNPGGAPARKVDDAPSVHRPEAAAARRFARIRPARRRGHRRRRVREPRAADRRAVHRDGRSGVAGHAGHRHAAVQGRRRDDPGPAARDRRSHRRSPASSRGPASRNASSTRATIGAKACTCSRCPKSAAVDHLRDAHRRAPHRGPDPRARAGAASSTSRRSRRGRRRRWSSRSVRTCSRRASRRSGRTRRSSCRSSTSRRCATTAARSRSASRWRSRRATSPARRADAAPSGTGWASDTDRVPDASRSHAARRPSVARQGPSGHAHRQPGRRIRARETREPLSRGEDRRDASTAATR